MASKPKPVVYVVGNPLVPDDRMPVRLLPLLQKARPDILFEPFEPTRMDIPQKKSLIFIDTVQGIQNVIHLHGLKALEPSSCAYSLHDFDLSGQLLLLEKFGLLGDISIIGVPARGGLKKIEKDVLHELEHILGKGAH
ncbi:Uncharacterised protein [uncultured archaeon]|nr:Uncharacterised protein [uncultured archaeon]